MTLTFTSSSNWKLAFDKDAEPFVHLRIPAIFMWPSSIRTPNKDVPGPIFIFVSHNPDFQPSARKILPSKISENNWIPAIDQGPKIGAAFRSIPVRPKKLKPDGKEKRGQMGRRHTEKAVHNHRRVSLDYTVSLVDPLEVDTVIGIANVAYVHLFVSILAYSEILTWVRVSSFIRNEFQRLWISVNFESMEFCFCTIIKWIHCWKRFFYWRNKNMASKQHLTVEWNDNEFKGFCNCREGVFKIFCSLYTSQSAR